MDPTLKHILNPTLLFGAVGTIAILSLAFKENRFYRLFQHIFLGLALGYEVTQTWTRVMRPLLWDSIVKDGYWAWIMAVPFGLMFYGIYTKRFSWMSRLIYGVFFGLAAGTVFQDFCQGFMPQVVKSFKPLYPPPNAHGMQAFSAVANNALFIAILVCVLVYFFFAFDIKNKIVLGMAKSGRLVLMFAFGAMFGATIMTRMALLIDRMYYLFVDWLRLAPK
jgi:hypothetical protein